MVDFLGEQNLSLFGAVSFGDVGGDAAQPDEAAFFIKVRRCRAGAPTHFAIRPQNAKLRLEGIGGFGDLAERSFEQLKVFRIDEWPHALERRNKRNWINPENFALTMIPDDRTARYVPLPAAHLTSGECKAAHPFALPKLQCR